MNVNVKTIDCASGRDILCVCVCVCIVHGLIDFLYSSTEIVVIIIDCMLHVLTTLLSCFTVLYCVVKQLLATCPPFLCLQMLLLLLLLLLLNLEEVEGNH